MGFPTSLTIDFRDLRPTSEVRDPSTPVLPCGTLEIGTDREVTFNFLNPPQENRAFQGRTAQFNLELYNRAAVDTLHMSLYTTSDDNREPCSLRLSYIPFGNEPMRTTLTIPEFPLVNGRWIATCQRVQLLTARHSSARSDNPLNPPSHLLFGLSARNLQTNEELETTHVLQDGELIQGQKSNIEQPPSNADAPTLIPARAGWGCLIQ